MIGLILVRLRELVYTCELAPCPSGSRRIQCKLPNADYSPG
jgi:hypothetical protein